MKTPSSTAKASVRQRVEQVLVVAYGHDISRELLEAYDSIIKEYLSQHWKTSELDAGHFVEMVRRIIEIEHGQTPTPVGKSLPGLTENELQKLANNTKAGDTFAILLPRALFPIYAIRNKRGAGHVGPVKPNEMDATYIVGAAKWILAEIVRVKSNLPPAATMSLVEQITERQVSVLWSWEDITRVLDTKMSTRNQILVLLFGSKEAVSVKDLLRYTEYSHKGKFEGILRKLHKKERLIEYAQSKGVCVLTSTGIREAEKILLTTRL